MSEQVKFLSAVQRFLLAMANHVNLSENEFMKYGKKTQTKTKNTTYQDVSGRIPMYQDVSGMIFGQKK